MFYGASPISAELLRECMDRFGCRLVQLYGLTETSGGIVALDPEDHSAVNAARLHSAGRPIAGVEIAILDEAGKPSPSSTVGEIAVRCVGNMIGYWSAKAATDTVLDADGWIRTGDAGRLDDDGYLFILDRLKDMIVSGGENIYPVEVENAVLGHPSVAEVAVIGVPSERWGEEVKAIVVAQPGARRDEAAIIAWTRDRIAGFKAPKSVEFVDALPKGATGKILRRLLRAPYWAGRQSAVN